MVRDVYDYINKNLITPEFLQLVEKWARFDGKRKLIFGDITVENMGVFSRKKMVADIDFSKNVRSQVAEALTKGGKKKEVIELYDVTRIHNDSVMTDFNTTILIAERHDETFGIEHMQMYPAKVFIYSVAEKAGDASHKFPTFAQLKGDFESDEYTQYHSLVDHRAGDEYKLMPFNEYTDRIYNYSSVSGDLRSLECEESVARRFKGIKLPKRFTKEDLYAYKDEYMKKQMEKYNK